MGILASGQLTLADWAKRLDPEGKVEFKIAEILNQTNEILNDAVFIEGNLPNGHRVTIRTAVLNNQGVPRSESTRVQVDESCGMLEAYSKVGKDLAELNGNTAAFRLSEGVAFLEDMSQAQARTLFYGNPATDPHQYLGLSTRYGSLSGAGNVQNIIDAGSTATNNASIWLVVWGENTVFCTFPKGSKAGLVIDDAGLLTVHDDFGNPYKAYQTYYQWKSGLVVKDWRYVVRICNINTDNLVKETAAADIVKLMIHAQNRVPNLNIGRAAFYMNRTLFSMLEIQALNKSQNAISIREGLTQFFLGVPIRKVDALLNTEARVV